MLLLLSMRGWLWCCCCVVLEVVWLLLVVAIVVLCKCEAVVLVGVGWKELGVLVGDNEGLVVFTTGRSVGRKLGAGLRIGWVGEVVQAGVGGCK